MMNSRRPVTSPGRVEKYAPPLLGFLRSESNGGSVSRSRSKGRSRASPLFVRRNKSAVAVTQEPSSPKVTCMGQVRVKHSNPKIQPESRENPTGRRCERIRNGLFNNSFAGKIKTLSFWSNWGLFPFTCSRWKLKEKDSPIRQLDRPAMESAVEERSEEEEENFKIPKLFVSPASTPPMNALSLTRSISAPYRSYCLAFRFCEDDYEREAESRKQNVTSENTNPEVADGDTEKINEVNETAENNDGNELELSLVRRPVLTRSKSDPARIREKMAMLPDEEEG